MRETDMVKPASSLASLWDAIGQWNRSRGFEDSTPGYVLAPLRGECLRSNARDRPQPVAPRLISQFLSNSIGDLEDRAVPVIFWKSYCTRNVFPGLQVLRLDCAITVFAIDIKEYQPFTVDLDC